MAASRDRRFVLGILGGMLAVTIAFSVFAPANDDTDLSPTTYNSGSAGIKAVYLLLGELGAGARCAAPVCPGCVMLRSIGRAVGAVVVAGGAEKVREPRLPLGGAEREAVLGITRKGLASRPTLPARVS